MQWSKEEEEEARKKVEENSAVRVHLEEQVKYEREASKYWDTFYKIHKNKFFKDRNWLLREFPEILPVAQKPEEKVKELSWNHVKINAESFFSKMHCPTMPEEKNHYKESSGSSDGQSKAGSDFSKLDSEEYRERPLKTELFPGSNATFRILEVGCGAGNSVFPILNTLQNVPEFFLYCCDFASGAVELVKSHASYRAAQCCAFVHDVCDHSLPYPFPDGTLDVILLVFVLSSIHPDRMQSVINRLSKLLKPGGMLLFRDYGRYDKTQLRFKRGHCLSENFYVRGDGTRAYFFTKVPYALSLNYEHIEVSTIMQSKSLLYSFVRENYSPMCEELPSWTSEAFRPLNFRVSQGLSSIKWHPGLSTKPMLLSQGPKLVLLSGAQITLLWRALSPLSEPFALSSPEPHDCGDTAQQPQS
ncbi:hypothetical protein JEQ12_009529 [Ovis aries]|uniref:Methyltransferase type 12 domain-containing protein n=1 Tax=Ovis aries TaxID=9940 RepID=A0A836D5V5_SHEEP|nr:hypothetical protein JEQ12_009529 [Ovis aries]